jgi:hypothetical protein
MTRRKGTSNDSRPGRRPEPDHAHDAGEAAAQSGAPPRVALRPDPAQWSADELMTLQEAAWLFWPMGPLTMTSLRTAVRDHQLDVAEIAGKILTNKNSIQKMCRCSARTKPGTPDSAPVPVEAGAGMPRSVAEYRSMAAEGRP